MTRGCHRPAPGSRAGSACRALGAQGEPVGDRLANVAQQPITVNPPERACLAPTRQAFSARGLSGELHSVSSHLLCVRRTLSVVPVDPLLLTIRIAVLTFRYTPVSFGQTVQPTAAGQSRTTTPGKSPRGRPVTFEERTTKRVAETKRTSACSTRSFASRPGRSPRS